LWPFGPPSRPAGAGKMKELLTIRIATMRVVSRPAVLMCRGLGSCVGVAIWDPVRKVGGMAHILLPSEDSSVNREPELKFADRGLIALVEAMEKRGCLRKDMRAKLAGGSRMFTSTTKSIVSVIGDRNVTAVKQVLQALGVAIAGEDTGGSKGRNMIFDTEDGSVTITTVMGEQYNI